MKPYRDYFDRQNASAELHEALLDLTVKRKTLSRRSWAVAAVCCGLALLIGGAAAGLLRQRRLCEPAIVAQDIAPTADAETPEQETDRPDVAAEHEMPAPSLIIDYGHDSSNMAADIALPTGSFFVDFADPQYVHTADALLETFAAAFPNYEPHAQAIYDGNGGLWTLYVYGTTAGGAESYSLELSPGSLPPACVGRPHEEPTVIDGVEVYGWSMKYDSNGDGAAECHCGSEFLTGKYGMRFENIGAPYRSGYNGETDEEMGGAMELNARFVELALSGALDDGIQELLYNGSVPAWEEERFSSLEEVRELAPLKTYLPGEYGAYLPKEDPLPGFEEFCGYYCYQEDRSCYLTLHWYKGYDAVDVEIEWPEGPAYHNAAVDVSVPESYDVRLYNSPWADNVPQEYRLGFYDPTFRAEDMSLEVIKARGWEKDAGGIQYSFRVLHESGANVHYACSGITAEEVWALVRETLH